MRKRNHTVTIRMNKEEYNLLQSKVKESGRTQQADETLGQLKQQCESLKSSMETLKSQISSTVESSEDEIQAKINTFSEEKKNWEEAYSRQFSQLQSNRRIYEAVQGQQEKMAAAEQEYVWMRAPSIQLLRKPGKKYKA